MSRRLIRVVLEYDDGLIEELRDSHADAWMDEIVAVCDLANRQGQNPTWSQYKWTTLKKPSGKKR